MGDGSMLNLVSAELVRVMDEGEADCVELAASVICNPYGEIVAGPLRYEEASSPPRST
jgi:hypothetical protein